MARRCPYEPGYTVLTIREPHGVTGHIIPWNYPMQIFGRTVGASLAAGNACVVKPAEDASLSILRLAELAAEIGFPAGALNVVTGYGHEAGAALTAHPGIDHISFTGSTVTGRLVAEAAAKRHCPVTLELGGKSPQLVFDDADLDAAAAGDRQRHHPERRPDVLGRQPRCWCSAASTRRCSIGSPSASARCAPARRRSSSRWARS